MGCPKCNHLFMEHDEMGCKHSACECKATQQSMMGRQPSLTSLIFSGEIDQEYWRNKTFKLGRIQIPVETPTIVPEKTFIKEYEHVEPDRLFSTAVESLKKIDYFKVWTADKNERSIEVTTYGASTIKDGWREQVYLKVEEADKGSRLRISVTPSLEPGIVFSFDTWHGKGVIERIADAIAKMIFEELDQRFRY